LRPAPPCSRIAAGLNVSIDPRLCVLVVEDDEDTSAMLTLLLESKGHRCVVARDATRALAAIREAPCDVALIDIGLPKTSGHELARQIRLAVGGAIRLIAATGYSGDVERDQARDAGFDALLVKPLELDELLRLLQAPSPSTGV
jgi:CheY-like chemotaxis protein